MIITLVKADFSANNIGVLDSWLINRALGSGATYSGPNSVGKGEALNATVTIADGYTIDTVFVTMGGAIVEGATISNNVVTISIAEVTGNIIINVATKEAGSSEDTEVTLTWVINEGMAINQNGMYENADFYTISDIPVIPGKKYCFTASRNICFYDADGNLVDGLRHGYLTTNAQYSLDRVIDGVFTIPENVATVSFCAKYSEDTPDNVTMVTVENEDGSILCHESVSINGAFGFRINIMPNNTSQNVYFGIYGFPVEPGASYSVPYLRNYCFYNEAGEQYSTTTLTGEGKQTATITAPEGYSLFCPCFKYEDITPENVTITKI